MFYKGKGKGQRWISGYVIQACVKRLGLQTISDLSTTDGGWTQIVSEASSRRREMCGMEA